MPGLVMAVQINGNVEIGNVIINAIMSLIIIAFILQTSLVVVNLGLPPPLQITSSTAHCDTNNWVVIRGHQEMIYNRPLFF